MPTQTAPNPKSPNPWPASAIEATLQWPSRMREASAPLYWLGVAMLALCAPLLILQAVDGRLIQGASVWLKPLKFALSTGTYLLTLALFLSCLPRAVWTRNSVRYLVWAAVLGGTFEVVYITWQGAQGLLSHFNRASPLAAAMYTAMGVGAVVLTSASAVLAVVMARSTTALQPAVKLAIVLGLALTFLLGTGFGGYLAAQRLGHWVGGALTDAGGLPMLGWSRSGGDLRVAHFFGIHAMHFIPALGLLIGLAPWTQANKLRTVWLAAAAFCALCIWTFTQARAGLPLLAV